MLDKPYADGGSEHSGRVAALGQPRFYDVTRQRTATRLVRGRISTAGPAGWVAGQEQNPEQNGPAAWAVELALSHTETIFGTVAHAPPRVGSAWRINFSRVERRGGVNWSWAAQRAWDASVRRFGGMVDMHRPEAWGYVVFAGVGGVAGRLECSGEGGSEREAHGGALESGEGSEAAWGGAVETDTAPVGLCAAGRSARRLGLRPALKAAPVDGQGGGPGRGPGGGAGGKPADQGLALGAAGSGWLDPLWPARLVAACCYYAQRQYFEDHGRCAARAAAHCLFMCFTTGSARKVKSPLCFVWSRVLVFRIAFHSGWFCVELMLWLHGCAASMLMPWLSHAWFTRAGTPPTCPTSGSRMQWWLPFRSAWS